MRRNNKDGGRTTISKASVYLNTLICITCCYWRVSEASETLLKCSEWKIVIHMYISENALALSI